MTQKQWDKISKGLGVLGRKLGAMQLGDRLNASGYYSKPGGTDLKLTNGLLSITPGLTYDGEVLKQKYGPKYETPWRQAMERDKIAAPGNFLQLWRDESVHKPSGTALLTVWSSYITRVPEKRR